MDKPELTNRETEIMVYISRGYSGAEIAAILGISKRTVDFHLNNVYSKLKVNNRIQALRELGWFKP